MAEKPKRMTAEKPKRMTAVKPRRVTAEKPRRVTAEKPRRVTVETPRRVTAEKPRRVTAEKPRRVTAEKPRRVTAEKPRWVTAEKPRRVTEGFDACLPASADVTECRSRFFFGELSGISNKQANLCMWLRYECLWTYLQNNFFPTSQQIATNVSQYTTTEPWL
ncbi:histone H1A-like [Esox lucius]|uniref:histone H1A-like n=1 Tax=Esox lucius TaxID=8010 RepID=UPI0014770339|nr:histone H1A-like [Esox lucius]